MSAETPASPSPEKEGAAPAADTQPTPEPKPEAKPRKPKARMETYETARPDGSLVKVVRNIETGEATYTDL